jgi:hypothetical protein
MDEPRLRPSRPLSGYRDVGDIRDSSRARMRSWVILAVLILIYLGWTLTVYFLEPGLR